jgi:hypothetical protein
MEESVQAVPRGDFPRRETMETPEEVAAMLRLKTLGWGIRRIARELGCSQLVSSRARQVWLSGLTKEDNALIRPAANTGHRTLAL